jgi:hypothetical protein
MGLWESEKREVLHADWRTVLSLWVSSLDLCTVPMSIISVFTTKSILVPVVYIMARDVMILMRANPMLGPLEGVGPENLDFFRP